MTWYSAQHTASRQLDILLEKKPKFSELLCYSDFIQHLRSYNSKLLQYITQSNDVPNQIVQYLAIAPKENDQNQRKYKLPLLTIEAIETETICIINSLFKISSQGHTYLGLLFKRTLSCQQVLPLLAGYFFRMNFQMMNIRPKQATDIIYSKPEYLNLLLNHPYSMAIVNTLQLYLNLDGNKVPAVIERINLKLDIITKMFQIIFNQSKLKRPQSAEIIQNLIYALIQIIDKYYLIIDGKTMVEHICSENNIQSLAILMLQQSPEAFPVMTFFLALLKYYSCSSFNIEQTNPDAAKKILERLQALPIVNILAKKFPIVMNKIMATPKLNLYGFKLLEVFCHATSLSSFKIFDKIKQTKFYACLIDLMFKNQKCNILHTLIQRAFLHVFITEKKIYDHYKRHLFCELEIIDLTAGRQLVILGDKGLPEGRKYGYFGNFMKILKIYSGIQTFDQDIAAAIKSKTQIWKKISKALIAPYEQLCSRELGTFQELSDPPTVQYKILKNDNLSPHNLINNETVIQEVQRQEAVPQLQNLQLKKQGSLQAPSNQSHKFDEDNFFNVPQLKVVESRQQVFIVDEQKKQENQQKNEEKAEEVQQERLEEKDSIKRSQSFKQFMNKQKLEVSKEIKTQRSVSYQKKISSQKTRLMSPSPRKKNSWKQQQKSVNKSTQQIPKKNVVPKLPNTPRALNTQSYVFDNKLNKLDQDDNKLTRSMVNLQELKNIKVVRVSKPTQKQYRKLQDKDKILLQFLGLKI